MNKLTQGGCAVMNKLGVKELEKHKKVCKTCRENPLLYCPIGCLIIQKSKAKGT